MIRNASKKEFYKINFIFFRITNITRSNEGTYFCRSYDEKGSMRDQDYVNLILEDSNQDCQSDEFSCGDGTCISERLKCDNKYDCVNMNDENGCGHDSFENEVELGGTLILECLTNHSQNKPIKWYRINGNQKIDQFSDNVFIDEKSLRIENIRADNRGIYRCEVDGSFKDNIVTIKG